jgi:uncharacterized protein (DUF305 family)
MTTHRIIMSIVGAAAALTVGVVLGGCDTNTTASSSSSPATSQSVALTHNQPDVAFAQNMIPHHVQAIAMSLLTAQRAVSPQVKDLSAGIQTAQQPEIDQMTSWLRAWHEPVPATNSPLGGTGQGDIGQMDHDSDGPMPGMMSGDQMQQLEQASGPEFERMFLQMMVTHHQGAITMAQTELRAGQNLAARQLAQRIIDSQQREITEMQALLSRQ